MGDRVDVWFQVRDQDTDATIKILEGFGWGNLNADVMWGNEGVKEIQVSEVNHADVSAELQALTDRGIPCSIYWHEGNEYDGGTRHTRFLENGELRDTQYTDTQEHLSDLAFELLNKITTDTTVDDIKKELEAIKDATCDPDWDNQDEYARRYLIRRVVKAE